MVELIEFSKGKLALETTCLAPLLAEGGGIGITYALVWEEGAREIFVDLCM